MIPTLNSRQEIHRWCRNFPGTQNQVGEARRFVATYLGNHPETGTAQLVVSELATNAIRHTRSGQAGGHFGVTLHAGIGVLIIAVMDEGGPADPPRIRHADDDATAGRGLHLVAELTTSWGVYGDQRSRTVWAILSLTPSP